MKKETIKEDKIIIKAGKFIGGLPVGFTTGALPLGGFPLGSMYLAEQGGKKLALLKLV